MKCEALNHNYQPCRYQAKQRHKTDGRWVCGVHAQKPAKNLVFSTPPVDMPPGRG